MEIRKSQVLVLLRIAIARVFDKYQMKFFLVIYNLFILWLRGFTILYEMLVNLSILELSCSFISNENPCDEFIFTGIWV